MSSQYEIRFLKDDESPTLIFWMACPSDDQAIWGMRQLFGLGCDRAEVWRGDRLVYAEDKAVLEFRRAS
jgi:hypothetical protein